jgi:hypothetical protein
VDCFKKIAFKALNLIYCLGDSSWWNVLSVWSKGKHERPKSQINFINDGIQSFIEV